MGKELSRAADAIYQYELDSERAEAAYQSAIDVAFLTSDGSIESRKAVAREKAKELQDVYIVAHAVLNRAKMKAKHLELEQMRLQTALRSIQNEGG